LTPNYLKLTFILALTVSLLSGCKEPPPPPRPTPTPTPTPAPEHDILGYTYQGRLWTMQWDGENKKQIFSSNEEVLWFPSASVDGSHFIAWISKPDGTQNLVSVPAKGGKIIELTAIEETAVSEMKNLRLGNAPVYDPTGNTIAYSFNGVIWIMDKDGYNAQTLIADGHSYAPAFSPDGKQIAYVNGNDGHFDLWITNLEDRDTWQITAFTEYSVGNPVWMDNGQKILLNRVLNEESDIILVPSKVDMPLVDADTVTTDRRSATARFDPTGSRIIFSSARKDNLWNIWSSDLAGRSLRQLTQSGGYSPVWMRPKVIPTTVPTKPPVPTAIPTTVPTAEIQPTTIPTTKPTPLPTPVPTTVVSKPAPTQPPVQAAPLKMRLLVEFDSETEKLDMQSLAQINKLSTRVTQYQGESIIIYGPLDKTPLRGKYPSLEDRSLARAEQIREQLARQARIPIQSIQALPYSPPVLGGQAVVNGIQIYATLKP
jgi:hypothetical protein